VSRYVCGPIRDVRQTERRRRVGASWDGREIRAQEILALPVTWPARPADAPRSGWSMGGGAPAAGCWAVARLKPGRGSLVMVFCMIWRQGFLLFSVVSVFTVVSGSESVSASRGADRRVDGDPGFEKEAVTRQGAGRHAQRVIVLKSPGDVRRVPRRHEDRARDRSRRARGPAVIFAEMMENRGKGEMAGRGGRDSRASIRRCGATACSTSIST